MSDLRQEHRLHSDLPPLRIEPEVKVIVEEGRKPQQRQPRAGRIGVRSVDGDPSGVFSRLGCLWRPRLAGRGYWVQPGVALGGDGSP